MIKKSVTSIDDVKRDLARFCAYQERCYQDVEKKLNTYHLIPQAKEEIILYLLQNNFLNEERFAKHFVSGKLNVNKWGRKKIEYQLRTKGVSNRNIQIALATIDDKSYKDILTSIATKKGTSINEKNPYQKRVKLTRYLQSKGYEMEWIMKVVEEIVTF